MNLGGVWIANEGAELFEQGDAPRDPWPAGRMLLTRDRRPIAWTDGHGASIEWLPGVEG
jgi:hypothetical protein